eukprot:103425-Pleurochrysis_carterae.AAC.1
MPRTIPSKRKSQDILMYELRSAIFMPWGLRGCCSHLSSCEAVRKDNGVRHRSLDLRSRDSGVSKR